MLVFSGVTLASLNTEGKKKLWISQSCRTALFLKCIYAINSSEIASLLPSISGWEKFEYEEIMLSRYNELSCCKQTYLEQSSFLWWQVGKLLLGLLPRTPLPGCTKNGSDSPQKKSLTSFQIGSQGGRTLQAARIPLSLGSYHIWAFKKWILSCLATSALYRWRKFFFSWT